MRQCSNSIKEHGGEGDWLAGMDNEFMNKYEKVRNLKHLKLRDSRVMGVQENQLTNCGRCRGCWR